MFTKGIIGKLTKATFLHFKPQSILPYNNISEKSNTLAQSVKAFSQDQNERAMPAVYYYQSPFQWLKIKWQLLKLKRFDREFNEGEFKIGSKQAISVITSIVKDEKLDDLEGLLTPVALAKLRRDILVQWNDEIIRNIGIEVSDIKLAVPTRVHVQKTRQPFEKLCDIDMWYMAMKWRDLDALLIIDFVARFNRILAEPQYKSDWTVSVFELRKYHIKSFRDNP